MQNPWYIWAILTLTSSVGICSEKTKIGSMLSSPLVTMFCTLVLCNINLLPSSHAAYSMVLKWLVPLAVPLLLLDADLRKCFKSMSSLFKAFLVGSMGSFLGSIIAFKLGQDAIFIPIICKYLLHDFISNRYGFLINLALTHAIFFFNNVSTYVLHR